jgi:hypothetical protein
MNNNININFDESTNHIFNTWITQTNNKTLLQALHIGFVALQTVVHTEIPTQQSEDLQIINNKLTRVDSSIHTYLEPIMDRFTHISNSIDTFTNTVSNASLKGKMGEQIMFDNIQRMFPNYELINMSQTGGMADFHLMSDPSILIEIKTYSKNVPSKEIDKFKHDVLTNNMHGILLSTTSGISNKKELEWEINDNNNILVYVPKSGLDLSSGIYAIYFILQLSHLYNTNKSTISPHIYESHITSLLSELNNDLFNLNDTNSELIKFREQIMNIKNTHSQQLQDLYNTIYKFEMKIQRDIINIQTHFNENKELQLSNTFDYMELSTIDQLIIDLELSDSNTSRILNIKHICEEHTININIIDKNISCFHSGVNELICKTNILKSKIYLIFPIIIGKTITFTPGIEKMDKKWITIEFNDANLEYITNRICNIINT